MHIVRRSLLQPLLIIYTVFFLSTSCTHESDMLSSFPEVCFESDVLPVFRNNCGITGCHDSGGESGYILNTFNGIVSSVVPGNPDASPSYKSITRNSGEGMMPPTQPLSQANRTTIRLWIYQGANNTTCGTSGTGGTGSTGTSPVPDKACFTRDILPVLLSSCAITGCHDATTQKEGYNYTTYSGAIRGIRAGSPSNSILYRVITTSGENKMPPSSYSRLSAAAVDSVFSWIKNGALNENCNVACDTVSTISYAVTLLPVIQNSCKVCHSGTSPSAGIRLETYANVASVAANGSLLGSIKGTTPYAKMPPSGSLTTCQITQFKKWIANGYPNN